MRRALRLRLLRLRLRLRLGLGLGLRLGLRLLGLFPLESLPHAARHGGALLALLLCLALPLHAPRQPLGAHVDTHAVDGADDTLALEQLELGARRRLDREGLCEVEEGGGDRVARHGLHACGELHRALGGGGAAEAHLQQAELALGERARLVEGERAYLGEELHLARRLDEDAPARQPRDAAGVPGGGELGVK
eukprot:scaffold80493_cov63-Phaeocystis_antarctica.AAC.2